MKFLVLLLFILAQCCSTRQQKSNIANIEDSTAESTKNLPVCIQEMIVKFSRQEPQNPPHKIYSYTYHGQTVYYINAPCCDNFNELYDSDCRLLGYPDGGFTGRGDGKIPDFNKTKTDEKLIWEDTRKP
ncbi:MAG: hypothetical protein J0H76_13940 [Sphingobacteriales bacterium]|nr:hypothetical protein [Sphingobacteriales bacterium]